MPNFRTVRNDLMNGFHIFRDGKEVTFIPNEVLLDMYETGVLPIDSDDFNKHIVNALRNMKVIKLHPSQYTIYTIERISA